MSNNLHLTLVLVTVTPILLMILAIQLLAIVARFAILQR